MPLKPGQHITIKVTLKKIYSGTKWPNSLKLSNEDVCRRHYSNMEVSGENLAPVAGNLEDAIHKLHSIYQYSK